MAAEYAARHGLDLDKELTFRDEGLSAYRGKNVEPGSGRLADFLAAVQSGLVPQGSFLLVEALDRLSRLVPRKALRVLEDIVDSGVTVVTLNDGRTYTTESLNDDHTSLLVAIVTFMRANEESATKARRLKAVWQAKRARAGEKILTRVVPAWLRVSDAGQIEPIPERVEVVRRIFRETLVGEGKHAIAKRLNEESVPVFRDGTRWHPSYVTKILSNPAVTGTFVPHVESSVNGKTVRTPQEPVHGYYPAVIDHADFERLQARRETAVVVRAKSSSGIRNVLSGLGKCPLCGAPMVRITKGASAKAGKPYLVCNAAKFGVGCSYRAVPLADIEEALWDSWKSLSEELRDSQSAGLQAEYEAVDSQITEASFEIDALIDSITRGGDSPALRKRLEEREAYVDGLLEQRKGIERQLADTAPLVLKARAGRLWEALRSRDIAKANLALRECMQSVTVRFDLESPSGDLLFKTKDGRELFPVSFGNPFLPLRSRRASA